MQGVSSVLPESKGGNDMPDYEKLYHIMFNAATDTERFLEKDTKAFAILCKAQQECEELYIEADEE